MAASDDGDARDPSLAAPGSPWIERKRKPDGSTRRYQCTLVHASRPLTVIRFVMTEGGTPFGTPITIPAGAVSDGYFWVSRPYSVYRMHHEGRIVAHRFDAVAGVRFAPGEVQYRDLVLDWWLTPGGELIEEDRDELDELAGKGALSEPDLAAVARAERTIRTGTGRIIAELTALERRLGIV